MSFLKLIKTHEKLDHRGSKAVFEHLSTRFPGSFAMEEVKNVLKNCMKCKMFNSVKHGPFKVLDSYELGEKAAFDIIGPIRNN